MIGLDGSRRVKAQIDPTGTGEAFTDLEVTTNGDLIPLDVGSQQITVAMPAGMVCTGGANGDTCLVSFKSAGGFGNCIGVTNNATAAATPAAAPAAVAATPPAVADTPAAAAVTPAAAAVTPAAAAVTPAAAAVTPAAAPAAAAVTPSDATGGSGAGAAVPAANDGVYSSINSLQSNADLPSISATQSSIIRCKSFLAHSSTEILKGPRAARYLRALERALAEFEIKE
ncbi:hypothetical protein HWV62_13381 [Athelia sp. TMB]|nr:hypothetical protein HWV62_13381 [Athelia sp. TMB]